MKKRRDPKDTTKPGKIVAMPQAVPKGWHRSAVVWIPAAMLLAAALDHMWVTEDAFITFKSVENLWRGHL